MDKVELFIEKQVYHFWLSLSMKIHIIFYMRLLELCNTLIGLKLLLFLSIIINKKGKEYKVEKILDN